MRIISALREKWQQVQAQVAKMQVEEIDDETTLRLLKERMTWNCDAGKKYDPAQPHLKADSAYLIGLDYELAKSIQRVLTNMYVIPAEYISIRQEGALGPKLCLIVQNTSEEENSVLQKLADAGMYMRGDIPLLTLVEPTYRRQSPEGIRPQ